MSGDENQPNGTGDDPTPHFFSRLERMARALVPFLVSIALLVYVFDRIDIRLALDHVTANVFSRFLAPLLLFSGVTVVIEAHCLHRVVAANPEDAAPLSRIVAARIKSACYLLGLLNHLLGAAALSLLIRRRTGASIPAAAGIVFLIALLDVGSVLACVAIGGSLLQFESAELRLGVVTALIGLIVLGFLFLRAPFDLGPLERVRELPVFRAPRLVPIPVLLEVGALRGAMVASFAALVGGLFWAFEVDVPLVQLVFGIGVMLIIAALPLAVAGIGTGQVVFVTVFEGLARDPELLAMSIVLSASTLVSRALLGLAFAPEFTREALEAARAEEGEQVEGEHVEGEQEEGREGDA